MPELSGRQQLELSLLCVEYQDSIDAKEASDSLSDEAWERQCQLNAARYVPLLRYVRDEGLTEEHFDRHLSRELNPAYTAVLMLLGGQGSGYARDCVAARALTAAGIPFDVCDESDDE